MKKVRHLISAFWYGLPLQLLLLHFRRYQVLLVFWYILFAVVTGKFLKPYGAESLMLAPEYLGKVSGWSTAFLGFSIATFIMSWNITTFILHTRQIRFMATTAQPFLKYCINNAIIPVLFLIVYFANSIRYESREELMTGLQVFYMISGFIGGFILSLLLAFGYFFGTDKTIYRRMAPDINSAHATYERVSRRVKNRAPKEKTDITVRWFLSATLKFRQPRNVRHYSQDFLDSIFKRHHLAAIKAVAVAFIILFVIGYYGDYRVWQVPAGASITLLFAILIAFVGALSLFLGNWSIPIVLIFYLSLNWLFVKGLIDPRNKLYGIQYHSETKPVYNKTAVLELASDTGIAADKKVYEQILTNWKNRQKEEKPVLFLVSVSGGGNRSAAFTMNVLSYLDSLTNGGFQKKNFLITGSSGGMLGAAYFRELHRQKVQGSISSVQDRQYIDNISKDLLNPVFSSLVTRDILIPLRYFDSNGERFIRDRGYAFEQQFNKNTKGILEKSLEFYRIPEEEGAIPLVFLNSVITRDGRKMITATHPARFMMKPVHQQNYTGVSDADGIDFLSFFKNQHPLDASFLSLLRLNATFPVVLPNAELPAEPVIDVMDAGLRDNFGMETAARFTDVFKDWLSENTSAVVLVEIRDRPADDWERPFEANSLGGLMTKPMFVLQNNWFNLQDYYQKDMTQYLFSVVPNFQKITFTYTPVQKSVAASLSFHLTKSEKKDIAAALNNEMNQRCFSSIKKFFP
jgi:hypothetical protein